MVPALVLTAGLATRLRPLSFVRAKAALPVAGVPLVRRILSTLAKAGTTDVVLNLHHLPHTLTALVGDGADLGLRVRYSWESPVLGSAGGPRRAVPLLAGLSRASVSESRGLSRASVSESRGLSRASVSESRGSTFLIVNGDTLTDVDVRALIDDHRRSRALVTIAVVPNTEPQKYSGIALDDDGSFIGIVKRGASERSWHVIGVQVAEAEAFLSLPDNVPHESIRELYPSLVAAHPGAVRGFRTKAEFFDIGTPADYLSTSLMLAEREGVDVIARSGAVVAAHARVERSILWDDVVVGEGSMLRECIVTDGVRVPADTSWHGVTIRVANGEIGPGERVIEGLAIGPLEHA
jgi:NDP-sugar pyrophosphorylase family protein